MTQSSTRGPTLRAVSVALRTSILTLAAASFTAPGCGTGAVPAEVMNDRKEVSQADEPDARADELQPEAQLFTCLPRGTRCTLDSQCCESHCIVQAGSSTAYCKQPGASSQCIAEGHACRLDAQCCSNQCVQDPKRGGVCKEQGSSPTCSPRSSTCQTPSQCCNRRCVPHAAGGSLCK